MQMQIRYMPPPLCTQSYLPLAMMQMQIRYMPPPPPPPPLCTQSYLVPLAMMQMQIRYMPPLCTQSYLLLAMMQMQIRYMPPSPLHSVLSTSGHDANADQIYAPPPSPQTHIPKQNKKNLCLLATSSEPMLFANSITVFRFAKAML